MEVDTMAPQQQDRTLGDVVNLFPKELEEPQIRQRLRKLADQLEELLFLDESGEVGVDRDVLTRTARNEDLVPANLRDVFISETGKHLGPRMKERGQGRHLGWREAAQYRAPIQPEATAALRKLGIDESSSVEDARRVLRERYPAIPSFWLEADAVTIRETTLRALAHNQTVWDCVVRRLGWWAALAVFAAAGAFLIVGTATGPWGVPLAIWLIGVLGGSTAVIVMNCVMNPSS
jgi:hypothetical protein